MDVHEKTKDNVKSVMDIAYICDYFYSLAAAEKQLNQKQSSFLPWIKEKS